MLSSLVFILIAAAPPQAVTANWKPYAPADGAYTIAMPTSPVDEKRPLTLASGGAVELAGVTAKRDSALFTVMSARLSGPIGDRAGVLDAARDAILKELRGDLANEAKSVREGGLQRDLTIKIPESASPGGAAARARILLVGNRLFELIAVQPLPARKVDDEAVETFLSSFKRAAPSRLSAKSAQEETKMKAADAAKLVANTETLALPGWHVFQSDEGEYTVQFPNKPVLTSHKAGGPAVGEIDARVATFHRGPNEDFVVIYNDYSENQLPTGDVEKLYDHARQGGVASSGGGRVASDKKVMLGELPGREIKIDLPSSKVAGGGVIHARYFLKDKRLYQVVYRGPKAKLKPDEIAAFLDSFRIIEP
jgi:hypothetical protein